MDCSGVDRDPGHVEQLYLHHVHDYGPARVSRKPMSVSNKQTSVPMALISVSRKQVSVSRK